MLGHTTLRADQTIFHLSSGPRTTTNKQINFIHFLEKKDNKNHCPNQTSMFYIHLDFFCTGGVRFVLVVLLSTVDHGHIFGIT